MIGVTRARTAGAIGRELMDTRYSAREVTSERREIHCRSSVEFIYNDVPLPMFPRRTGSFPRRGIPVADAR